MATTVHRLTVDEYAALPAAETQFTELHHGEIVTVPPPKGRHIRLQDAFCGALAAAAKPVGKLRLEMPFALPPRNLRTADIGYVSWSRWNAMPDDGYLQGAPELVIEIMSPSNTAAEMEDREALCLGHGCIEFWTVFPELHRIRVARPTGVHRYNAGDTVTCSLFPGWSAGLDDLLA